MSDFTKEELLIIHLVVINPFSHTLKTSDSMIELKDKLETMIDNYCEHTNIKTIGTGQLLFHNKGSESAILAKIAKQITLCENSDETECFRIDWKIIYGKKFGH